MAAVPSSGPCLVAPNDVKHLDVGSLMRAAGVLPSSQYGSLALRYTAEHHRNLYAAIMIRRMGRPIAFHIDALESPADYEAGSREGIWWLPRKTVKDWLIVTNQSALPIPAKLTIFERTGRAYSKDLLLGARETRRFSVRELIEMTGFSGDFGGLSIRTDKNARALDATHIVFDEDAGFSGLLKMFDHENALKLSDRDFAHTGIWTLRAPMLALQNPDPALGMPTGVELDPIIFIRNSSSRKVTAKLLFNWHDSASAGQTAPSTISLSPFETQLVRVAELKGDFAPPTRAHWASVILTTDGPPNEVQAVSASYDITLKMGAQTPFSDQLSHKWAGGMWESDANHNSLITAGNGGSRRLRARFTLLYAKGTQRYELEQTLAPSEQMWIDVRQLKEGQVADVHGQKLPKDIDMGSYQFEDLSNIGAGNLYEGKVVYDATNGHVTYGCAVCCGYNGASPFYNPINVPLEFTAGDGVWGHDTCTGNLYDVSNEFAQGWHVTNTSIATVVAGGTHTGHSVGGTTSGTSGTLESAGNRQCNLITWLPSAPANTVPIPVNFHFVVASAGTGLAVQYNWNSSSGKISDLASCSVSEVVTYSGNGTTANGKFSPNSPPFPSGTSVASPFTSSVAGNSGASSDGTTATLIDYHNITSNTFVKPYSSSSFVGTQYYRFTCGSSKSATNLAGPLIITFAVALNGSGGWKYTLTKTNVPEVAGINPLP